MSAMQSNPGAARIVFESGVPVTMVPLEVTHTALATPALLQRLSMYTVSGRQATVSGRQARAGCSI